jgi:hypothetical protein
MGRNQTATLPLIAAGLALLPGCVLPPPAAAPPVARPAAGSRFAEYITAPGQRVAVNDPATAAAARPSPGPPQPIPDPPDLPPPLAPAAGSVQPPTPAEPRVALAPPPPADPPLVAAVRAYLDNRPDLAVEHLRGFDKANQELLLRLLPAVAHAQHAKLTAGADAQVLVTKMEAASDAVARVAPLDVRKACFVWQVKQFGVYDPLPANHAFLPGGMAVLYAEVQNAPSDPTPHPGGGDGYVTRLHCELHLLDAAGKQLARFDPTTAEGMAVNDFTRSPLRDVFLRLGFQVPKAAGAYTAVFVVRDPATGRSASKKAEFRVAGP